MTKAYTKLREDICFFAKSMFDRGLTSGNSGNISVRTEDGGLLVTPTGSSFGRLDPAQLSLFNENLEHISGDKPTKEMPLHQAFYETRTQTGAVVHLHSTHSVALSLLAVEDEESFLPPLTPYAIMKLGKVTLLPFMLPGSDQIGQAIRGLAGKRSAVMLAHHGPVVAGKDLEAACFAMEELEETSRLALLLHGKQISQLSQEQVQLVIRQFNVEW
ncbi:MAG: aldolase [Alphaproteobacteria bacterium]